MGEGDMRDQDVLEEVIMSQYILPQVNVCVREWGDGEKYGYFFACLFDLGHTWLWSRLLLALCAGITPGRLVGPYGMYYLSGP